MMSNPQNLLLFISDAHRADHWPEGVMEFGETVDTICQASYTFKNLPTILSGVSSEEHGGDFYPIAGEQEAELIAQGNMSRSIERPTVLDLDQAGWNVSMWDHPNDPLYATLRYPPRKPLSDLSPPFVFVFRHMGCHVVYGKHWETDSVRMNLHNEGRVYRGESKRSYSQKMEAGDVDFMQDYRDGVVAAQDRYFELVDQLRSRGLFEDTACIFTADHGECFGWEHDRCPGGMRHGKRCEHCLKVKTTYTNVPAPPAPVRSADLLDEWWESVGVDKHSLIPRPDPVHTPNNDNSEIESRLKDLGYI